MKPIMMPSKPIERRNIFVFVLSWVLIFLVTGCSNSQANAGQQATQMFESALLTATYSYKTSTSTSTPAPPTATLDPSPTPIPPTETADPFRTPPALPPIFQTSLLNPVDTPHIYQKEICEVLKNRWDPGKSEPGTVVMPIMFHSITDNEVTHIDQISVDAFNQLMRNLKDQGFEAITTEQLVGFLENNAKIPPRSVLLIVDDRKRQQYFDTHFKPYYETNGWKVVNAWISAKDTPDYLWKENQAVSVEGYVDHQAHGVVHNIPMGADSSEDFLRGELFGSVTAIEQYFHHKPVAIIWPGGGFAQRPVEIAREAGFKLGFTVNPRGPLMYNWIPLADVKDEGRPSYMPEGAINDPLMVLPRYWDTDASVHIDTVRQIGKEAAAAAKENRAVELEYYDIVCKSISGPIPGLNP